MFHSRFVIWLKYADYISCSSSRGIEKERTNPCYSGELKQITNLNAFVFLSFFTIEWFMLLLNGTNQFIDVVFLEEVENGCKHVVCLNYKHWINDSSSYYAAFPENAVAHIDTHTHAIFFNRKCNTIKLLFREEGEWHEQDATTALAK